MKTLLALGLLAALACAAEGQTAADWTWVKSSVGNASLCAGARKTCDSAATCTAVAIGPCGGDAPEAYLQTSFVGMGYVDAANYLDCSSSSAACTVAAHAKQIDPTGAGYRDAAVVDVSGGGRYAYGMAGNVFGDMATAGGYLGIAHYLNIGDSDISTNTNDVYVATANTTARADRSGGGGSAWGAPVGPYRVCISDVQSDGSCGAARTFKPNEYKFSVFGHISGANYSTTVAAGQNGFPAGMSHLGVRVKVEAVGFKPSDLNVNGRAYDTTKVTDDVTAFSIRHARGGLNFSFPTKYNLGSAEGARTDGTLLPVSETKTVKIRIHSVDATSMLVDYLFESSSLAAGKYLMYDPTVALDAPPPPPE
eukprot:CAMPEP_0173434526 /NCGR_PEP_ID=MMETSP1357-20121228/13094_1 /TAXON_ID=77926 /ORGANISM="Hemiselmis rufescens, Strain PCC563" /LENGTH=365 /DNA_ID=CAMNT_0014399403 /DNA_START=65 /DNA_END=1159 /DNA_ORIENTATION=-